MSEPVTADVRVSEQSSDVRDSGLCEKQIEAAPLELVIGRVPYVRKDYADGAALSARCALVALQQDRDFWKSMYENGLEGMRKRK